MTPVTISGESPVTIRDEPVCNPGQKPARYRYQAGFARQNRAVIVMKKPRPEQVILSQRARRRENPLQISKHHQSGVVSLAVLFGGFSHQ